MKNPLIASIVGASMTTCLLFVTGLNYALMVFVRNEQSRPGATPLLLMENGTLLSRAELEALATRSGVAFACVGAALLFGVLIGILAINQPGRVSPILTVVPGSLVLMSFLVVVLTELPSGTMTEIFTLLALAGTAAQALAVARQEAAPSLSFDLPTPPEPAPPETR